MQPALHSPRVADGDELRIAAQEVRLFGMDAPEADQVCKVDGRQWRCGEDATAALQELIGGREVECFEQHRHFDRTVAVCYLGPWSLNAAMVLSGWALDYEEYSGGVYRLDQEAAQAERVRAMAGRVHAAVGVAAALAEPIPAD